MPRIVLRRELYGSILDIGGGGEGVIGRLYGDQVIAVDNRQEELDEAPDCCEKRLMDATALAFEDRAFENATFFYSLMYMPRAVKAKALSEAHRALRHGGRLYIWDAEVASAWPEPFTVHLDISLAGRPLLADYGVAGMDVEQDMDSITALATKAGFAPASREAADGQLWLRFIKP